MAVPRQGQGSAQDTDFLWARLVSQSTWLNWLTWINSFFSAKLIESIQFLFQVSWLVTESIHFHKVGDWVNKHWGTGMIESIELIQNISKMLTKLNISQKKVNKIECFPKQSTELNVFYEKVNKIDFPKNQHIYWVDWLIKSFESILWLESICMYLVAWLNGLVYSSYANTWWLNQFIFTFCHDWVDWFGMSHIQVCSGLSPTKIQAGADLKLD